MSDQPTKENNELAQVLSRINTLMNPAETKAESPIQTEADIPQLTEVYEGESLSFISSPAGDFPILSEIVRSSVTDAEAALGETPGQAKKLEALLTEMAPLVQAAVKKAVAQKLLDAEKSEHTKIEAEIMQILRERLQLLAFSNKS